MQQSGRDLPDNVAEVYLVGDLRVDVGQQVITRADHDIPLPNLSFRLLVTLIRAAPNVVSNDMLMKQVWPDLIVSPETINKRANLLRDALGDDAREPRYIAGVRSRGYRLVATVSRATGQPKPEDPPRQPEADAPREAAAAAGPVIGPPRLIIRQWPRRRWAALSAVLIAFAVAVIGIPYVAHRHSSTAPAELGGKSQATPAPNARERTVAVLPFDNISADPSDAYLAQGLPEMILNRLSSVAGVSVIARNSSFALSTKDLESREIGRRLNSGYLIGGSVQRDPERLRVAVQLVDAQAGTVIWSTHVDRGFRDIFRVEDEIAEQIAGALTARIGEHAPGVPARARSANLEAYLAFLRGRTLLGRLTVAESESAVPYFERAIALDPNFAAPYASLYDARMQAAGQRRENLAPVRRQYRHLIDRALQLDPDLGTAYFARAMWEYAPNDLGSVTGKVNQAREQDFRRGAELDPSNGRGLVAYAEFLYWILDRTDEGKSVLKRALWVDPMSVRARFADAEFSLDDAGVRISTQKTLQVLELDPNFVPALQRYGLLHWGMDGKLAEAIQIVEHAIALDPTNPQLRHLALALYLDLGDVNAAQDVSAGGPQSARIVGLRQMRDGDWRAAAISAYDDAGWTDDSDYCDHWLGAEAIRDYALKTGEIDQAMAFIKQKFFFGSPPAEHLDECNNHAAVYLSQLLAASGQPQAALSLRHAAASWNDANESKYLGGARRLRALILLLDGKRDAALTELSESFRSGYYMQWWYAINEDPSWLPLHADPRFKAIAANVHRYIDDQRRELQILRDHGVVPKRGGRTAVH